MLFYYYSKNTLKSFRVEWKSKTSSTSDTIVTKITSFRTTKYYQYKCYDIKPVRKEEGKSYSKIPLCDDDATREK